MIVQDSTQNFGAHFKPQSLGTMTEPVLVAKKGGHMITGTVFPSTSEDDASSLFSIDINDELPSPSSPSSCFTPHNGSCIGTHCSPSPIAEISKLILSQGSLCQAQAGLLHNLCGLRPCSSTRAKLLRLRKALLRQRGVHKTRGMRRSLWEKWRQFRKKCSTFTKEK